MKSLKNDIDSITSYLAHKQERFEETMRLSRQIIMESGRIITMLHNNDFANAERKFKTLAANVEELGKVGRNFEYYTLQAQQEFAEAAILLYIKKYSSIPSASSLHVRREAYLLGLMDSVGELKREILELLRSGNIDGAEKFFEIMKKIYDSTRHLRFTESILPEFRKKQDTARIQLENAGSEILMFKSSH
ncbi:MAG: hypothetical protein ACP5K5_02385 [Candidatus Micrarchaeia archaeon]